MTLPDYEHLLTDKSDGVLTITLNRPERLNAANMKLHHEIEDVFVAVEYEHDVRAIVLTGAGRGFCAGGDFSEESQPDDMDRSIDRDSLWGYIPSRGHVYRLARNMMEVSKPVVAAVNGPAAGLGATLALLCDVVYMAESARIGDRHTKMGLTAGDAGTVLWPLLIGLNRAKEILMSGDMVDADEAYRLGLANHVVPDDQVVAAATEYAKKLATLPEMGVRTTKLACNKILQLMWTVGGELAIEYEARCFTTPEVEEMAREFREARNRG